MAKKAYNYCIKQNWGVNSASSKLIQLYLSRAAINGESPMVNTNSIMTARRLSKPQLPLPSSRRGNEKKSRTVDTKTNYRIITDASSIKHKPAKVMFRNLSKGSIGKKSRVANIVNVKISARNVILVNNVTFFTL